MKKLGLATPQILLPNKKINLKKWAVVACDQYNSNIDYWRGVEKQVGNNASTLHIILPEVYLEDNKEERILNATHEMEEYVAQGVVEALPPGFVLVQRELAGGTRTGIVAMMDLEKYHYKPRKDTKIRPTEQTVMERIPPRVEIRKPALLESPHILVLLNDPRKKVIEPLARRVKNFPTLYDFQLMENGGRVKGSFIGEKEEIDDLYKRLEMIDEDSDILFAVGDGNHSLATAKTVWDAFKQNLTSKQRLNHPKRFALVEVVNLYDEGLIFEPIHRVVFNVDPNALISELIRIFNRKKMDTKVFFKRSTASKFMQNISGQSVDFIGKDRKGYIQIGSPLNEMEAVNFQEVLDEYLKTNEDAKVEYIHGKEELERLCEMPNTTGFVLPKLDKHDFIEVLAKHGVLPKKCFSLGEADEKRYYLETRLLDEIMEVDENDEILTGNEKEIKEVPKILREEPKKKWSEEGNNEDVISFAFADDDTDEDFELETRNEYLLVDEEDKEPNPEDFLSRRELRKLKRQQRIEALLSQGDVEAEVEDYEKGSLDEYVEQNAKEPPLSRKELKLLKRQEEYELLLSEINRIKVEKKSASDIEDDSEKSEEINEKKQSAKKTKKEQIEEKAELSLDEELEEYESERESFKQLTWIGRIRARREEKLMMLEEARSVLMEGLEQDSKDPDDDISNDAADKRAKKRQGKLNKKIEQAHDMGVFEEELEEYEDIEMPLTKKEQRALRRQEKLESLLKEIEDNTGEPLVFDEERPLTRSEEKRLRKEERKQKRIEEMEAYEKEIEEEYRKRETEEKSNIVDDELLYKEADELDEKTAKRREKLKKRSEIADCLDEGDDIDSDLSEEGYVLEKARLRLEKEKIRLEKFRIKEETKLKVQIEREKRKQIDRAQKEANQQRQREELEQILEDEMGILPKEAGSNSSESAKTMVVEKDKEQKKRGFGEVLDDIISEVKETEQKDKAPEKVIVRRDTKDIIGKSNNKDNKKREKFEKKRRGAILIKRAGSEYKKPSSDA
jgi:hypothetical protein